MRQTSSVLYLDIDDLVPARGSFLSGLDEFFAALDRAGVPAVWLSSRTRLQLDEPRRRLSHTHPFIAEDGCGVYLPQDYFHLRPETEQGKKTSASGTVRLGRFTCVPIAKKQPAAAEALESIAKDSNIDVVPLRSLSPRELAQNSGLPPRDAELARQRDFDELFFFVGASTTGIERFKAEARMRNCQVRTRGSLQSLAVEASVARCIRELSKLYDRALHLHARSTALAVYDHKQELLTACDRGIVLVEEAEPRELMPTQGKRKVMEVPLHASDKWERILQAVTK